MKLQYRKSGSALVTGASKRIGKAIAIKLSEMGYAIAIHHNKSSFEAKELRNLIIKNGGVAEIFSCDFINQKNIQNFFQKVLKKFPDLNLIVNSASIFNKDSVSNCTENDFSKNFSIHVQAPLFLSQYFAQKCKAGKIINILDTNVVKNQTQHFTYLLSKKTLANLTQMSAIALAPRIRVNAIAPGFILSPVNSKLNNADRIKQKIPLKKQGNVKNITDSVEFLIRNEYLTGQILFNDGGEHLL